MGLRDVTSRESVLAAIAEYDEFGREVFLDKYGFATTAKYFIVESGNRYDAKAITGAAHGYQHGEPMAWDDFSGGRATVVKQLESLDFIVDAPERSPDWARDELILALDLYLTHRGEMGFGKRTPQVVKLSTLLRGLGIFPEATRTTLKFRNPDSVAMKIHNFEAIDPSHPGKGMPHSGQGDQVVWDEWSDRPDELAATAAAIRVNGKSGAAEAETGEAEEYEADEGRILYRLHRRRERDQAIIKKKKADVLAKTGKLACEVCGFESGVFYGEGVEDVIDVHHIIPLHKIGESKTRLKDLALVCPNCHRAIHKHKPFATPAELRAKRERL